MKQPVIILSELGITNYFMENDTNPIIAYPGTELESDHNSTSRKIDTQWFRKWIKEWFMFKMTEWFKWISNFKKWYCNIKGKFTLLLM